MGLAGSNAAEVAAVTSCCLCAVYVDMCACVRQLYMSSCHEPDATRRRSIVLLILVFHCIHLFLSFGIFFSSRGQ